MRIIDKRHNLKVPEEWQLGDVVTDGKYYGLVIDDVGSPMILNIGKSNSKARAYEVCDNLGKFSANWDLWDLQKHNKGFHKVKAKLEIEDEKSPYCHGKFVGENCEVRI